MTKEEKEKSIANTLKNSNNDANYDFIVKGIYKDNTDEGNSSSMYSKSVNTIITGNGVIEKIVADATEKIKNVSTTKDLFTSPLYYLFSLELAKRTKKLTELKEPMIVQKIKR